MSLISMATRLMISAHQALALIFLVREQLDRWQHRANRIRDWRTLFHVFLPTNALQGLTLENMMATSPVPCFQGYTDHETDEMRLHPTPLQFSHQHDVAKRDLKMRSYSTCPILQSASNQVHRLEGKQPHRHKCIPGQVLRILREAMVLAPSIALDRSTVRNGSPTTKEDSRHSARQSAPLFLGIFFKALLSLRISFRVARIRCDLSPAMPSQHPVDRRCGYMTANSLFIGGMYRRHDKNTDSFSRLYPWYEKFLFLFKTEMSPPPSAPRKRSPKV